MASEKQPDIIMPTEHAAIGELRADSQVPDKEIYAAVRRTLAPFDVTCIDIHQEGSSTDGKHVDHIYHVTVVGEDFAEAHFAALCIKDLLPITPWSYGWRMWAVRIFAAIAGGSLGSGLVHFFTR